MIGKPGKILDRFDRRDFRYLRFYDPLDTLLQRNLGHGTIPAHSGQFNSYPSIVIHFDQFHIAAIGL
jgi:hypothetical protein